MGYEKPAYEALDSVVLGKRWKHPGGPGRLASPNHRLAHAAVDYAGLRDPRGDGVFLDRHPKARILAILRSQADPRPGEREGIGVVEGGFEQSPGDHHAVYHVHPTLVIALVALRAGDAEVLDLALRTLGRWYAMWRLCSFDDGRVAAPGTRRWPFRKQPPKVGADGLVHEPRFAGRTKAPFTFSPVADAMHRRLAGFNWSFIDNRGVRRPWGWGVGQNRAGFAAIRALDELLRAGAEIPLELAPALCVPIERGDIHRGVRLRLTRTEEQIGGFVQGYFPAVQVTYDDAGPALVAWAPHTVPAGWGG